MSTNNPGQWEDKESPGGSQFGQPDAEFEDAHDGYKTSARSRSPRRLAVERLIGLLEKIAPYPMQGG